MKNYIRPLQILSVLCFQLIITESFGQCPISNFSISSPVCSGSPLQISNNSSGASSYKWDFTPGFFSKPASRLNDTLLNLSYPGDITLANENDTNIMFISGFGDGKLHRVIYGNGPENPITLAEDLGNFGVLYQPTDIALYKEDSTWFGLITDYGSNYLFRIRFGNSLRNTPDSITTVLTNVTSNFVNPWSIKITTDSTGSIYGLVCNHTGGSISILSFGNSIRNIPIAGAPIIVPGTTFVQDAAIAKSCGNWYALLAGNSSGKVIRADFGNSLSNTPIFNTIITNGGSPSDLILIDDSSHWKLIYTDFNSFDIKKYDLGNDLGNITPVFLGSDYFNGQNPKGICSTRKGATTFIYVLYSTSHEIQTLSYSNPVNVNQSISKDSIPNNVVFVQAGTYPVTLFVTDANGNYSSYTDSVVVTPAPNTNFIVTNKCFGDATSFIDSSVLNNGTIISWNWNFGDGDSSTVQNETHTYLSTGSYNVRLITSSSYGCLDTLVSTINITPRPQASFSSPSVFCSKTFMPFTDQSTVSSGTVNAWIWRFGNGDSSNTQNPLYSYPNGGNYQVKLTITTAAGCSDSTTTLLSVNYRPQAGFTIDNTCISQNVVFTDRTLFNNSSAGNYVWDFGDGNSDTVSNPSHLYVPAVTTYPVQLIVTATNGCNDTSIQTVKINNIPTVNFSFLPSGVCQNNNVAFTDLSTVNGDTISGWYWDFGNNEFDTRANPVHQFITSGLHTVSLIAYSPSKCPGAAFQQVIDVKESPVASFSYSTTCFGNSMHFINNSTPATGSTIDSVLWTFNASDTSFIYNPDFTFASEGNYPVVLTVLSPEGCKSSESLFVQIHSRPSSVFSHSIPCTGDSLQFSNVSICDSLSTITQYEWNFGDLSSGVNDISSLLNPKHKYSTTQNFTVSLISTTNFGCKDTSIKNFTVNQSPSAQFTYSPTCLGSLMEFFNPGSPPDSSYLWNFGDNQTNQLREPAHYYAFPGTYTIRLQVTSKPGCSTTASKQVSVSPIPVADFNSTPACLNTEYILKDNSSIITGSINKWEWNIATLPKPDSIQNPHYIFPDTGAYNVTLTIISDIGCTKSVSKIIKVNRLPVSSFSFDPQFGNPPLEIQTTDYSTEGAYYLWDFGDGNAPESIHEPSHIYNDTGLFVITQYVTSQFGCKDTSSKNIYVINPILDIAVTGDSSYFEGNYFHVIGRIENRGTREITSLQMEATLENGNTIREELTDTIPNGPLGYFTYPFHASFLINPGSDLRYYCIHAINPNGLPDNVPENNERCFNLTNDIITINAFPNPFANHVTFRFLLPQQENMKIELIDQAGRIVRELFEGKANKNLFEINNDLSDLPDGLYSVKVTYRDRIIGYTIVKNNHSK